MAPFCLLLQFHCDHVAQPSLSQMSLHDFSETLLPNHWCVSSCASVLALTLLLGKWIFVCTSST